MLLIGVNTGEAMTGTEDPARCSATRSTLLLAWSKSAGPNEDLLGMEMFMLCANCGDSESSVEPLTREGKERLLSAWLVVECVPGGRPCPVFQRADDRSWSGASSAPLRQLRAAPGRDLLLAEPIMILGPRAPAKSWSADELLCR